MRFAFLSLGLLSSCYLPAQQTSLSGPVEAITFDAPTRSLRAVIGFPGAASFGPALLDNLDLASVAPRHNYGIVFESGKCLFVSGLNATPAAANAAANSRAPIAGVTAYPEGIVWSADGSLAILYSRSGRWFQAIAGFPNSPVAQAAVDVSSLGGEFTAIAADTSGRQIAVAISGESGAVYESAGGQLTRLVSIAKPVSLSFSSDAQTLYALDAASLQVTAASLNGQGFQTFALPGIANPVAIQSLEDSQNRQLLYVAGGSDRMVRIIDVASRQIIADVALGFQPTCLDPFGSASFVLAARSRQANPLWLFAQAPLPGAYFVPAVQLRPPDRRTAATGRTR
jgi:hypothetical protein